MKFNKLALIVPMTLCAFMASCRSNGKNSGSSSITSMSDSSGSHNTSIDEPVVDGDGEISGDSTGYSVTDSQIIITKAGEYTFKGNFAKQIYVNAADQEVVIILNGAAFESATNSPIFVYAAESCKVKAAEDTTNKIKETRSARTTADEADESLGNGAIYAKCDLSLVGKGTLWISTTYFNGVHTTKDLKIKNQTLQVTSANHCLKGNDSVTIESGTITLKSNSGDGIKTEDFDVSSKGNQRGNVTISGGSIEINSAYDGIDASYDAILKAGEDGSEPTVNIYTNKYASSTDSGSITNPDTESMYLRSSTSLASGYRLACYFFNDSSYEWADASYVGSQAGGRSTYFYWKLSRPTSYSSFKIYLFSDSASDSTTDYKAVSSNITVNSNYDTCTFNLSGSTITDRGWTNYSSGGGQGGPGGSGAGGGGNTDKSTDSAKGIKAADIIDISAGSLYIKAYDDGLHANYGTIGTTDDNVTVSGLGDVNISGGSMTIYAADDGVRADRHLNITGGLINVNNSYEGLEGNVINISGGSSYVIASDDGINACTNNQIGTPNINITGGFLDVAVSPSGDTDGIDSNGGYTQTGGVVITHGPGSQNMSSLDIGEGYTAKVSGGSLIAFGKPAATISTSGSVQSSSKTGTYAAGAYAITIGSETYETTLHYSYSGCYCWSELGSLTSVTTK